VAIDEDQQVSIAVSWYIIRPDSTFKSTWNILLVMLLLYVAIVVPYRICFVDTFSEFWYIFDFVIDGLFGIDVIINFMSAYYNDDNKLITKPKLIAKMYLKS